MENKTKPVTIDKQKKKSNVKDHKPADIFPYIIIFSLLTLIALGCLTWVLGEWYRTRQCFTDPNIWCFDTWQCNANAATGAIALDIKGCFQNATQATGLASCVYGPNSALAMYCYGTGPTSTTEPLCECALPVIGSAQNCLAGCPTGLGDVTTGTTCCCCPGTTGCQYTKDGPAPPSACYGGQQNPQNSNCPP